MPSGNKTSLELRGPVEAKPLHPAQVPMAVARGLHGVVLAAATGAGGMLRPGQQQAGVQEEEEEETVPMRALHSFSSSRDASAEPGGSSPEQLPQRRSPAAAPSGLPRSPTKPGQSPFGARLPPTSPLAAHAAAAAAGQQQQLQPALLHSLSSGGASLQPAQGTSGAGTPTAAASGFAAKHKHLRRASMQDNSVMETVATEPGTMLVRVTSGVSGPAGSRQLRRM